MFMKIQHEVEVWIEEMSETIRRLSAVSEDSEKAKGQLANAKVGKQSGVVQIESRMRREENKRVKYR